MIFFASADTRRYLSSYQKVPHIYQQHTLIAVAGAGFLHGINDYTNHIYVVDREQDNLLYWQAIVKLIQSSVDLADFVSIISGQKDVSNVLSEKEYSVFSQLFDNEVSMGDHPEGTLNPAWFVGEEFEFSAFSSEVNFHQLKRNLVNVKFRLDHLQKVDYSELQHDDMTVVFVSNADNPCYTKNELIYHRVLNTMAKGKKVYFYSWKRQLVLRSDLHHFDCLAKLVPFTRGMIVTQMLTYAGHYFSTRELECEDQNMVEFGKPLEEVDGRTAFLYHISSDRREKYDFDEIRDMLGQIDGLFHRIIIVDHVFFHFPEQWISWFVEAKLHYSYSLANLDWSGGPTGFDRNFIMVWDMRGFHRLTR